MSSFGLYFASISVPIAQRVLAGLGMGVVTYTGLSLVLSQIQSYVLLNYGLIPSAAAQIMALAGVPQVIGIVLGALVTRFSMLQLKSLSMIP